MKTLGPVTLKIDVDHTNPALVEATRAKLMEAALMLPRWHPGRVALMAIYGASAPHLQPCNEVQA